MSICIHYWCPLMFTTHVHYSSAHPSSGMNSDHMLPILTSSFYGPRTESPTLSTPPAVIDLVLLADEHGCRSQHVSNSNSASIKHLSLLPSPIASSQPTLPRSIHHLSSIIHHQWQLPISSLLNYHLDFLDIQ